MSKYIDGTSVDLASFSGDDILVVVEQSGQRDTYATINQLRALLDTLPIVGGTANGVLYLNGSKVVTSGSALTFDGTTLSATSGGSTPALRLFGAGVSQGQLQFGSTNGYVIQGGSDYLGINFNTNNATRYTITDTGISIWSPGGSEQMRLTSTGLGIGTNNPATRLHIDTASAGYGLTLAASSLTARTYRFGLDSNANLALFDSTAAAVRLTLDTSGILGLGVTPSAWGSAYKALQVSTGSSYAASSNAAFWYSNAYNDNTNWRYVTSTNASGYTQFGGAHSWFTAPSGTAGDPISFTQALTLDANRNLLLNGTSAGASAVGTLAIFNGTAPTGSVTDGIILYAEDVSSSSELKVRDEAGNVTTLSPHNFSLIPEGPSEDMAWAYYSEKDGKRINVDMLKLARMVEKLTGEKLVYSA